MFNMCILNLFRYFIVLHNNNFFFIFFSKFFYFFCNYINFKGLSILLLKQYYFLFYKIIRVLSFSGKSYYVYLKRNYFNFSFHKRNINYLFFRSVFKFLTKKKTSFKLLFFKKKNLSYLTKFIKLAKRLNVFTGSGLKLSKSVYFSKRGKVQNSR